MDRIRRRSLSERCEESEGGLVLSLRGYGWQASIWSDLHEFILLCVSTAELFETR